MKRISGLLRSSGGQAVASSGAVLLLTVVTGVLSARMLQVQERGITAAVLALCALLAQAGNAGPAEAQLLAPQRGHPLGAVIRITWLYSLVITLLSLVPAILYLHTLTHSTILLDLLVATLPASATIGLMCNYLLLSEKRFGASALLRTLPIVVQAFALTCIWLFGTASVLRVIMASWMAGIFAGFVGLILVKPWIHASTSIRGHWREVMRLIFAIGGSHAIRIIGYRLDLILLGMIAGGHAAGLYSVAISLPIAGNSLTANLTPLVATRTAGEDSARFTQASSLFALLIALGIFIAGPFLIPLVYGRGYAPGWGLIGMLAAAMYGSFLLDTTSRIFQRAGYERVSLRVSITVLIIQLISIPVGSILIGATGAALGNLVAYVVGLCALFALASRRSGVEHLSRQLSPYAGLSLLLARIGHR